VPRQTNQRPCHPSQRTRDHADQRASDERPIERDECGAIVRTVEAIGRRLGKQQPHEAVGALTIIRRRKTAPR
jgi:hypothetical protein